MRELRSVKVGASRRVSARALSDYVRRPGGRGAVVNTQSARPERQWIGLEAQGRSLGGGALRHGGRRPAHAADFLRAHSR